MIKNKLKICIIGFIVISAITVLALSQTRRFKEDEFTRESFTIDESQTLSYLIKVCDPDGDVVEIKFEDLPPGASVSPIRQLLSEEIPQNPEEYYPECTSEEAIWYGINLVWTPTYEQSGEYKFYVHAIDDRGGDDWVNYTITVDNKNRPPYL